MWYAECLKNCNIAGGRTFCEAIIADDSITVDLLPSRI